MATSDKSYLYKSNIFIKFFFLGFPALAQQSTFNSFLNGANLFCGEFENIITLKPCSCNLSNKSFNFLVGLLST